MAVNTTIVKPKEYGVLIYDVPQRERALYNRLRNRISKEALRVNWSVWLIPWAHKQRLEAILEEINHQGIADAKLLKFDSSCSSQIEQMARESLTRLHEELNGWLRKKISEAEFIAKRRKTERSEELDKAEAAATKVADQAEKRLARIQALAVLFGLEGEVTKLEKITLELIKMQRDALEGE